MNVTGRISTFGGPNDTGVSPVEGLAIFEESQIGGGWNEGLFLPKGNVSGLARRLNPKAFYCAMRWDYGVTPKDVLRNGALVRVSNPKTGKVGFARPVDWGPHGDTNRVIDMSPGLATHLGLNTDDMADCELVLLGWAPQAVVTATHDSVANPLPSTPQSQSTSGRAYALDAQGWLSGATKMEIRGGEDMGTRRCVVEHFTGGATAASSVQAMVERGVSAHFVIDRDGSIIQCRSVFKTAGHAGKSRWMDPKTKTMYFGLNDFSIGIEIANAGNEVSVIDWAIKHTGAQRAQAKHRNGGPLEWWEVYSGPQIRTVKELTKFLVERFNLDDVTGHDCVAPERKNDPGPLFPMQEVREYCGFQGLPVVHNA